MSARPSLDDSETAFVLTQRVGRLATVSPQGHPHVVPVCYAFGGTRFYTPLDEKRKRVSDDSLQRVRNIESHPQVALVIDRYSDDWSQLGYVLVHGHAELIHPGDPSHSNALVLLRQRYPQYREMALEQRPVIAILPERITSWGLQAQAGRQPPGST